MVPIAENLKPSKRGELEITHVNEIYLKRKASNRHSSSAGALPGSDTGTHDALFQASNFIQTIEAAART